MLVRCRCKNDEEDDSQQISTPLSPLTDFAGTLASAAAAASPAQSAASSPFVEDAGRPVPPVDSPVDAAANAVFSAHDSGAPYPLSGAPDPLSGTSDLLSGAHDPLSGASDPLSGAAPTLVPDPRGRYLRVTALGKAAYKGGVDLDWAQRLYDDLKANLQVTQVYNARSFFW